MSSELSILALYGLWIIVVILIQVLAAAGQVGLMELAKSRDTMPRLEGMAGRLRGHPILKVERAFEGRHLCGVEVAVRKRDDFVEGGVLRSEDTASPGEAPIAAVADHFEKLEGFSTSMLHDEQFEPAGKA